MRVMAVWFPDWPTHAAGVMAVSQQHRVRACSSFARAKGIRRDMRVREAQALYPALTLAEWDADRDAREFEPVVRELEEIAPSVEVLRPGLVVIDAGAAGRFYGSEDKAVQLLADAASLKGVDCMIGIADTITTAIIAARQGAAVPPGESLAFLKDQPLGVLKFEEALGCEAETLDALGMLGIRTLGELAQLPPSAVVTRFGRAGLTCQRIALGREERKVAPELPTTDLRVSLTPEEAITRVDEAAFLARTLAAQLHEKLQRAGVVCQRLKVIAEADVAIERVWRTREPLTESATADRVRWQLDGWLSARQIPGIVTLALEPLEVSSPGAGAGLWGAVDERAEQVRRVVARVQSLLGTDAVLQPRLAGGRGPAERTELIPYGEEVTPRRAPGTWLGVLPSPLPARAASHPATKLQLLDATGTAIHVTADAILSATPAWLVRGHHRWEVTAWAGPWPVDDRWWDPDVAQKYARMQVVVVQEDTPRAFLIVWLAGQWRVEATYD
ncbi:DNA polymerase IV [Corynebacterium kalinowskii]|uniref:DNA polymerase IV n=2 Tax=Corynebacterium kalinowskii TaxID=2675216 RepID=A0A6B8VCD9_9CORY|nr:DNA polymerase IV [Corynebacterium kalinowskii]